MVAHPVIPGLWKLRQKHLKFESSLGSIGQTLSPKDKNKEKRGKKELLNILKRFC
jgi:hypothetical protein